MLFVKGDLHGVIAAYSKAIEIDPHYGTAYKHRVIACEKKGDAKGAAEDKAKAASLKN